MAGSLGELFIQLAFEGDTKEADKFIKKTQEIIDKTDKEIKKNKLLIDYLRELKDARNDAEKTLIKKNFAEEFKKLNLTKQLDEAKDKQLAQKNAVMGAVKAFAGYITAVSGAIYAVKKLTDSLIQQNQTWLNLTRTSDIALNTFQKWNSIGRMYGIDNAAQQIKNLNDRLFELKLTGANAQGFMLAGINPTNADEVMEQLRNRVSGLSNSAAGYLLRQLGLDENMLHILRLSREEFSALNAEMKRYRLTPDQQKSIQEMNVQLQTASQKLQYLKDRAILAIMPVWVKFVKFFASAGDKIKDFTKHLKSLIVSLGIFSIRFIPFSKIIASIPQIFSAIIAKMPVIKSFLMRIGITLARYLAPLTAIYLIVDDIMGYFEGKNSGIGYIINAMKDFQKNGFFSDDIPKWLQILAETADKLYYVFTGKWKEDAENIKELHKNSNINTVLLDKDTLKELKELQKTITDPERLQAVKDIIKIGNIKNNPFFASNRDRENEIQRFMFPHLQNNSRQNTTNINFDQKVDIQSSSQPARDTYNQFTNGLIFTNSIFARGAAV